jgi:hypothetical protein
MNNTISGFFGAFIFSIALAFKFGSVVSFIVKEREDKSKHQQIVSGMNVAAYWLGNFVYDFALYSVVAVYAILMCEFFDIQPLIEDESLCVTALLFLFYGLANIPLTYMLGYIFADYGTAQGTVFFFNLIAGGVLPFVILVLRWININANRVGRGLAWILRVVPAFSFGEGLVNMGSVNLLTKNENNGKPLQPYSLEISLAPMLYLIVFGYIYIFCIFTHEWLLNN